MGVPGRMDKDPKTRKVRPFDKLPKCFRGEADACKRVWVGTGGNAPAKVLNTEKNGKS